MFPFKRYKLPKEAQGSRLKAEGKHLEPPASSLERSRGWAMVEYLVLATAIISVVVLLWGRTFNAVNNLAAQARAALQP